jgi:hypothetical protein
MLQGHPFHFDRDSITINHNSNCVQFTGTWGANGERYRIVMLPGKVGPGGVRGQLQVGAQHICSSSGGSSSAQDGGQQQQQKPATDLQGNHDFQEHLLVCKMQVMVALRVI